MSCTQFLWVSKPITKTIIQFFSIHFAINTYRFKEETKQFPGETLVPSSFRHEKYLNFLCKHFEILDCTFQE